MLNATRRVVSAQAHQQQQLTSKQPHSWRLREFVLVAASMYAGTRVMDDYLRPNMVLRFIDASFLIHLVILIIIILI